MISALLLSAVPDVLNISFLTVAEHATAPPLEPAIIKEPPSWRHFIRRFPYNQKKFIFYFVIAFTIVRWLMDLCGIALWHNNGFLIDFLVEK